MADLKMIRIPASLVDKAATAFTRAHEKHVSQLELAKEAFEFMAEHYEEFYQKPAKSNLPKTGTESR